MRNVVYTGMSWDQTLRVCHYYPGCSTILCMLRKALHFPLHQENDPVWALGAHSAHLLSKTRGTGHTFLQTQPPQLQRGSHPSILLGWPQLLLLSGVQGTLAYCACSHPLR